VGSAHPDGLPSRGVGGASPGRRGFLRAEVLTDKLREGAKERRCSAVGAAVWWCATQYGGGGASSRPGRRRRHAARGFWRCGRPSEGGRAPTSSPAGTGGVEAQGLDLGPS
jgi:hypothetical protein